MVSRGLLDQPPGLYPEEEMVRWRSRLPSLTIDEVPELNHYTIMLHPSGAARVAASVYTELTDHREDCDLGSRGPQGRSAAGCSRPDWSVTPTAALADEDVSSPPRQEPPWRGRCS